MRFKFKFWRDANDRQEGTLANDTLVKLAEMLIQDVGKQGLALDYSPESLVAIDKILKSYGVGYADKNMGLVEVVGAYFGEVLRRRFGGDWYENVPPDGATGLLIDKGSEFWVWCHAVVHKQLTQGNKSLHEICQEIPGLLAKARG